MTGNTNATPQILVGILASNQKAKSLECLDSLAASEYRDFEVFLVDNGSSEDIGKAAQAYDSVAVNIQARNLGCAGGRNVIIRHFLEHGAWPYLFFLDNDTRIQPGALNTLLRAAQTMHQQGRRVGALGPHVVYADNPQRLWCAGGARIDWTSGWFTEAGRMGTLGQDFVEARALDTLTGGFMFCARHAVEATGPFTEDYFIYLEDTEWCWRMRRKGFELWSVPDAVCAHHVSSSLGSTSPSFHYYRTRNRLWFFTSFSTRGRRRMRRRILKHVLWHSFALEMRAGQWRCSGAILRGLVAGLRVPRAVREAASAGRTAA